MRGTSPPAWATQWLRVRSKQRSSSEPAVQDSSVKQRSSLLEASADHPSQHRLSSPRTSWTPFRSRNKTIESAQEAGAYFQAVSSCKSYVELLRLRISRRRSSQGAKPPEASAKTPESRLPDKLDPTLPETPAIPEPLAVEKPAEHDVATTDATVNTLPTQPELAMPEHLAVTEPAQPSALVRVQEPSLIKEQAEHVSEKALQRLPESPTSRQPSQLLKLPSNEEVQAAVEPPPILEESPASLRIQRRSQKFCFLRASCDSACCKDCSEQGAPTTPPLQCSPQLENMEEANSRSSNSLLDTNTEQLAALRLLRELQEKSVLLSELSLDTLLGLPSTRGLYERGCALVARREEALRARRQKLQEEMLSNCTFKPCLSKSLPPNLQRRVDRFGTSLSSDAQAFPLASQVVEPKSPSSPRIASPRLAHPPAEDNGKSAVPRFGSASLKSLPVSTVQSQTSPNSPSPRLTHRQTPKQADQGKTSSSGDCALSNHQKTSSVKVGGDSSPGTSSPRMIKTSLADHETAGATGAGSELSKDASPFGSTVQSDSFTFSSQTNTICSTDNEKVGASSAGNDSSKNAKPLASTAQPDGRPSPRIPLPRRRPPSRHNSPPDVCKEIIKSSSENILTRSLSECDPTPEPSWCADMPAPSITHGFMFGPSGEQVVLDRRDEVERMLQDLHCNVAKPLCEHFRLRYDFLFEQHCQEQKAGVTRREPHTIRTLGPNGKVLREEKRYFTTVRLRLRKHPSRGDPQNEFISHGAQIAVLLHELTHLRFMNHGPQFMLFLKDIYMEARRLGLFDPSTMCNDLPSSRAWENAIFKTAGGVCSEELQKLHSESADSITACMSARSQSPRSPRSRAPRSLVGSASSTSTLTPRSDSGSSSVVSRTSVASLTGSVLAEEDELHGASAVDKDEPIQSRSEAALKKDGRLAETLLQKAAQTSNKRRLRVSRPKVPTKPAAEAPS